ncbi:MAG: hypothetical protein C0506_16465, partial [Anaerolinea sp.]|nr:hypothetical protein [Anaerolinea sp.]
MRRALPKPDEGWVEEAGPNDPADFHVSLDSATGHLAIGDAAAHPLPNLPPLPADDREPGRVVRRLEHLARYRAVEEIENHDEDSLLAGKLVVELLGKQEKYQKGDERKPKLFPAGVPELNPGEWTFLRIRNTSAVSLNVAVLNLEPGWGVSPVFPKSGLDRSFETIEPGKERCLDLQASIPDGIEEGPDGIKVFGAVGTADFRSLALPSLRDAEGGATRSARGDAAVTTSRGGRPPSSLDGLFARLTDDRPTRALTAGATPSEEWTVTSVTFRVRRPSPSLSPQRASPISEAPSVTAKTAPPFFPDIPVLGSRSPEEVAEALRAMGDPDAARALPPPEEGTRGGLGAIFGWGEPKAWQHTAHQLGFIAPGPVNSLASLPIVYPGVIAADPTLKDSRINIHLDRLRVEEYPGGGEHVVMITFRAQNQLPSNSGEPVSFSQVYRVRAGQAAPVAGYPLCIGLGVGKVGAALQFFTVNVKDSADEATVGVLESSAFTGGLNLLTTAQPALKLLTDLTLGIAKQFATRNRNRPVQDYYLGLDFAPAAFG